jgi:hypothetical protein
MRARKILDKLSGKIRGRTAAAGKALIVWFFSGSFLLALLAFVLFKMIGW